MTTRTDPAERKAAARTRKLAGRLVLAGGIFWFLAVLASPVGLTGSIGIGGAGVRSIAACALAGTSLVLAAAGLAMVKPWKARGMRTWALLAVLATLVLGDLYLLRLNWPVIS